MTIELPLYAQEKDNTCALACLRMVLAAFGTQVEESVLESQARMEERGNLTDELERLARLYLNANIQHPTLEELRTYSRRANYRLRISIAPCLICVLSKERGIPSAMRPSTRSSLLCLPPNPSRSTTRARPGSRARAFASFAKRMTAWEELASSAQSGDGSRPEQVGFRGDDAASEFDGGGEDPQLVGEHRLDAAGTGGEEGKNRQ